MSKKEKIMHLTPLRSGVRKGVAILFCIVIVVSVLILPVSALNSGGLEIQGTNGYIWQPIEGKYYYATIKNNENDIVFNYQWNSFNGTVMTEVVLSVAGSSYGRLSLSYQSAFGNTSPNSSFEGLYDGKGNKLVDCSVGNNYYAMVYEGEIPNKLIVRGHFTCSSTDVIQSYTVLNVSFTNLENQQIIDNQNKNTEEIKANQDKNSQEIQANQDKNADKIIANDNQLQENEKNEANGSGNSGIDSLTGAIPNYGDGLIDTFRELIGCMSHNEVLGGVAFPGLVIPSIGGWFDEITLINPCAISFEGYVIDLTTGKYIVKLSEEMYDVFLSFADVIRIFLSIALYLFCIYELYDLIEYILTLRKGSN